ncbi:hypothetical protein SAMN05428979_3105 [Stappia sp. ES.058]|nr:hypothetical protein SAMN05428979_3105 [Stappia sp. ES.058]
MTAMAGADLCGYEGKPAGRLEPFKGLRHGIPCGSTLIRRTAELTSTCGVKALDRGNGRALWAFPCISRHLDRHFSHGNRS